MKVTILNADITKLEVDAIVNASDKWLSRGGGVSGAIHSAAGPELEKECIERKKSLGIEHINIGDVVITNGYQLPVKYVFHTLGPVYGKDDIETLEKCYTNCMGKADSINLKKIAFPAISTGIFGVPVDDSARIVKRAIDNFTPDVLEEVFLVFINDGDIKIYGEYFK